MEIFRYITEESFDAYLWVRHEVAFVIVRYETTIRRTCGSVRSSLTAPARGATFGSEAVATTALRLRTGNHPRGGFPDCQRQRGLRVRLDDMPNISELLQASLRPNKPKTLSGLSQKATQRVQGLDNPLVWAQNAAGEEREPKPIRSFQRNTVSPYRSRLG